MTMSDFPPIIFVNIHRRSDRQFVLPCTQSIITRAGDMMLIPDRPADDGLRAAEFATPNCCPHPRSTLCAACGPRAHGTRRIGSGGGSCGSLECSAAGAISNGFDVNRTITRRVRARGQRNAIGRRRPLFLRHIETKRREQWKKPAAVASGGTQGYARRTTPLPTRAQMPAHAREKLMDLPSASVR